jgi:hypothetical protein
MEQNRQISPKIRKELFETCRSFLANRNSHFDSYQSAFANDMALISLQENNNQGFVVTKLRELEEEDRSRPDEQWIVALLRYIEYLK